MLTLRMNIGKQEGYLHAGKIMVTYEHHVNLICSSTCWITHASLLNSFRQIQQVRLSTWLEFSSVEEDGIQNFLPPRDAAGS